MKKSMLLVAFAIVCLLSVINANAKIRRVGYFGPFISGTDYYSVQAANDAASAGDTLLIYPGNYGTAYINRRLIIIGYGYFVTGTGSNPNLQAIVGTLGLDIRLNGNADSTILEGLDGLTLYAQPGTPLKGVVIRRCNIVLHYTNANLTNWQITQSVVNYINGAYGNGGILTNLFVSNCIIGSVYFDLIYSAGSTGVFENNIFGTGPTVFNNGSYTLKNNVFLSTTAPTGITNCIFDYNIASNNIIPNNAPYNHNQTNVNIGAVFVGYPTQGTYSNDGRYVLAAGSPAIGTGENGVDCGVYGTTDPYRLSGIPPIPSFYKLTAPSTTTSGNPYTITFSVRSNN